MRNAILCLVACVLLLSLVQEGDGHGRQRYRSYVINRLRRLHRYKVIQRIRLISFGKCNIETNCRYGHCCVRDIIEEEDSDIKFEKLGECVRARDLRNQTVFMLNRIDDEIAAAADRTAELGTQAAGQDLFILCRAGTLGPDPTPDPDATSKRGGYYRPRQLSLGNAVKLAQGRDVAVAVELETPTPEPPIVVEETTTTPEAEVETTTATEEVPRTTAMEEAETTTAPEEVATTTASDEGPLPDIGGGGDTGGKREPMPMMELRAEAKEAEDLLSNMVGNLNNLF